MDVFKAIQTRRSHSVVTDTPVPKEMVENILSMAVWAPTHRRTEPWRFHVFMGKGRDALFKATCLDAPENIAQKVYRAPVIIAVTTAIDQAEKKVPLWEEEAATAAAIQNIGLAAHGYGLAGIWRTGKFTTFVHVQRLLNVDTHRGDRIMGFFYMGYPDAAKPATARLQPDWSAKTTFYT